MTAVGVRYPLDALVSYHYYREDQAMAALVATGRLRMIGDSGAFSAFTQGTPIKLAEYVSWVRRWGQHLCWCAALDVIGDPGASLSNWRAMRDRHQLETVPTLHVGTDPRWMDAYAREGVDFIGLGGMVGRPLQSLPWVVSVFRYARKHHPQMRFHIWGITNRQFLDNLPAYSADSSGIFGSAYRYAQLRLFDPSSARHTTVQLKKNNVHKMGTLLRRVYGIPPEQITRSTPANRHLLVQAAARSTQLYAAWLQARHNVSPPTWALHDPSGQGQATTGTRVHAVSSGAGRRIDDLARAVTLEDPDDWPTGTGPAVGQGLNDAVGTRPPEGTRVHCVDGSLGNLLAAAGKPEIQE